MKKILFALASLIIGVGIFVMTVKFIGLDTILNQFRTIEPSQILIYLTVSTLILITLVLKWKIILQALGFKVPFFKLLMYRQMGFSVGYIIPSFYIGGETVRAFFLKKHKVPLTDAISSVVIDRAVELPMNFLLACVMFFLVIHTLDLPIAIVAVAAVIIAVFILFGVLFYYKIYHKEYFFSQIFDFLKLGRIKKLAQFKDNIKEIESNLIRFFNHKKKVFFMTLGFSCLLWFLMILEFTIGLRIVGYEATLSQIYLVVVMTGFALMFPVPASIGVLELSQIGIAILVGIPLAVAVALSLLIRTRDFMWIASGVLWFLYHGTNYVRILIKDITNKNDSKSV